MSAWRKWMAGALVALAATFAYGHGGVSMEDDVCTMRIGPYRAHFAGYQPELRATQEFCEDIPEVGRAIIVLDYVDAVLRTRSVEFRVMRDTKGLKAGARYEDLGSAQEMDAATLFKMAPQVYPKGTLNFDTRFTENGWYIGVLTATDPATGEVLHSVFPFRVGVKSWWRYVLAFVGLLVASVAFYRLTERLGKRRKVKASNTGSENQQDHAE